MSTAYRCDLIDTQTRLANYTSAARAAREVGCLKEAAQYQRKADRAAARLPIVEARAAAHEALMSARRVARGRAS